MNNTKWDVTSKMVYCIKKSGINIENIMYCKFTMSKFLIYIIMMKKMVIEVSTI